MESAYKLGVIDNVEIRRFRPVQSTLLKPAASKEQQLIEIHKVFYLKVEIRNPQMSK